jgi:site-specific DNA recombinase
LRPPRGQPEQPRQPFSVYAAEGPGIPIAVPALVSPDLFATVGEQLEENRRRNRQSRRGARWLLQGLLVCQTCGYGLYGLASRCRLADGRTVAYAHYRCTGRNGSRFGGQPVCSNRRQVSVADLDNAVWSDVCDLLRNPAKVRAEYERRRDQPAGEKRSLQAEQVAKQIHKVKQTLTRLIDAYAEGVLDKQEFAPRLQAAKERLARLEAEARKEADQQNQERELRLALGGLEDFAQQVTEGLEQANWYRRREIIRALVKRIEVGPDEVRVVYRVGPPPFVNGPCGGTFEHCGSLLETPLPQVADEAEAPVEVVDVGAQQAGHQRRQLPRLPQLQQQVEVIGHETIVEQAEVEALAVAGEQAEEMAAGVVVGEDGLAVVAAVQDVVTAGLGPLLVAGGARHDGGSEPGGDLGAV